MVTLDDVRRALEVLLHADDTGLVKLNNPTFDGLLNLSVQVG
jgi:hypothetical protein